VAADVSLSTFDRCSVEFRSSRRAGFVEGRLREGLDFFNRGTFGRLFFITSRSIVFSTIVSSLRSGVTVSGLGGATGDGFRS
jgi:hypothetical protein